MKRGGDNNQNERQELFCRGMLNRCRAARLLEWDTVPRAVSVIDITVRSGDRGGINAEMVRAGFVVRSVRYSQIVYVKHRGWKKKQ